MDIHVIKRNNKYIVFNPESFSLFTVTEDIGKILESYESLSESLPENMGGSELDIVKFLNSLDKKTYNDICKSKSCEVGDPNTLCLIISHDCNLQCGYCFADHGTFGGEKKLMSFETAKKIIDKLLGENSNNFIMFYGGEPFLNFPLMKDVIEYGVCV